ncbi:hypothetical protein CTI12_AA177250 [Artemisia annua]|uniref:Uncharacterized protein n=1 Tax=Artemisia annua TaxID=35608 RepID=A0A2U1PA00_ARTAN|nr:hypothetical protein CTI12_AA177250 [Artemisia annua]
MSQQVIIAPTQPPFNLQDFVEVMKLSKDFDSVDITHTNTYKITFNHRPRTPTDDARPRPRGNNNFHMEDVDYEYAPPQSLERAPPWRQPTEPSATLMSSARDEVRGYPAHEYYGYPGTATCKHDRDRLNGCCNIL